MLPEEIRSTVRRLQQAIAAIDRDWSIAVCSPDARFQATVALLLERCTHTADSIGELLALPLPSPPAPLLVLCDDDMPDGGAEELIAQLRTNRSAEQCRVLVCLAPEISATRLEALWRGGADGLCCYRNAGSGQLLKTVWSLLDGEWSCRSHPVNDEGGGSTSGRSKRSGRAAAGHRARPKGSA